MNEHERDKTREFLINKVFLENQKNNITNINDNELNNIKKDVIELLTKKYNYDIKQLELPIATFIDNLRRLKTSHYDFKFIP